MKRHLALVWQRVCAVLVAAGVAFAATPARADALGELVQAIERGFRRPVDESPARAFVLDTLRLEGDLGSGPLRFELRGSVIGNKATEIDLFGPASQVRIARATIDGRPALIGFDHDSYFLRTDSPRFVLRGDLYLDGDLALVVAGPINTFEADLRSGRVAEGARLSGLTKATLHFDKHLDATAVATPTVFQLARAIRVGQTARFDYQLQMRSGSDLGVVRLPLDYGERVLDVEGSAGWRIEGGAVLLPTSGKNATITVSGTMPGTGTFLPDARSTFEWWLVESDPKHRLLVETDAKRADVTQSPLAAGQPSAKLYLVERGQKLGLGVQQLVNGDVLAGVVRAGSRSIWLSPSGSLLAEDWFSYENNGIDYLSYVPTGKPIYLESDSKPEQIVRAVDTSDAILIPMKTGKHEALVQQQSQIALSGWFGKITIPGGSHPLATGWSSVRLSLAPEIVPILAWGGDEPFFAWNVGDAVAVVGAFLVALVALRRGRGRWVAGALLAGLWFMAPRWFVVTMLFALTTAIFRLVFRLLSGWRLLVAFGVVGAIALTGPNIAMNLLWPRSYGSVGGEVEYAPREAPRPKDEGSIRGVNPVRMPTPNWDGHEIRLSRSAPVRGERFEPAVVYCTRPVVRALGCAWALACLWLVVLRRPQMADGWRALLDALARWNARWVRPAAPSTSPPAANAG